MDAGPAGTFGTVLADTALPDLVLVGPQGQRAQGTRTLVEIMESDVAAGVRQRVRNVVASSDLTLLECDLLSPASDPGHCPAGVLWLMSSREGRLATIRLFHPAGSGSPPTSTASQA
jgi:RNA polymerase sigma-70 factor (ECF subfamily)